VLRIALLTGGSTPERDVALTGAAQVAPALRSLGHEVTFVDTVEGPLDAAAERRVCAAAGIATEPPTFAALAALRARENLPALVGHPAVSAADLVFLLLHGDQGEGGSVQGLLDLAGLRYTGSGMLGSAVAMDKAIAKRVLRDYGLPQSRWLEGDAGGSELVDFGLPLVVKPSKGGSSVGVSMVHAAEDLPAALDLARAVDPRILVEEFLPGREFAVGVLGDRALGVGEIVPEHEFFDYECKYTAGMSREIFPAEIPAPLAEEMRALALHVHRALDLRDFSRVDFKLDAAGRANVLEANTVPGMTAGSLYPQSAAVLGLDFATVCGEICRLAMAR
jgi:D-alanine-D-alanine ligase